MHMKYAFSNIGSKAIETVEVKVHTILVFKTFILFNNVQAASLTDSQFRW